MSFYRTRYYVTKNIRLIELDFAFLFTVFIQLVATAGINAAAGIKGINALASEKAFTDLKL